ncbi:uncharacterized protein ACN63O_014875 [Diretmus argenteus]
MATVPTGPSSALPASPAESAPFPGGRSVGEPGEHGQEESGRDRADSVTAGTGKKKKQQPQVTEVERSIKKNQKNMLARAANPTALRLKMQPEPREQQQNGSVSPTEDPDERPDDPRASGDNCDEGTATDRNNSAHCQHEGHGPFSKNGSHPPPLPPLNNNNNSMNGTEPSQPQPPVAELARLDLKSSPGWMEEDRHGIHYVRYESELQMPWIMRLITKDLSEPYSIYTYRYFIHNWPQLCFLVSTTAWFSNWFSHWSSNWFSH